MKNQEIGQCMTLLTKAFPSGPWDEGIEQLWMIDLHSFEADVFIEAVRLVREDWPSTFCPPKAKINEAVRLILNDRQRRKDMKALAAPKDIPPMTDVMRELMAECRATNRDARPQSAHLHSHGVEGCVLCKDHDHTDTRTFGFSIATKRGTIADKDGNIHTFEHREPVPGWWFVCPACGRPEYAREACNVWTTDGIAWLRQHGMASAGASPRDPSGPDF